MSRASAVAGPVAGDVIELRRALLGELLEPGDSSYDRARRVWNGAVDKHPGLIVRCAAEADVACGIRFAREHGLPLAVRAGGHSIAGKSVCDGGVMLDLSPMRRVRVDPERRTAHVQPGVTLGELDRRTQAFGLATTLGVASETGVAGLTLGGGYGWLAGRLGLACDNLRSVEVVTAEGERLVASENDHPDLFWAVRGGGGNFGVVTELEFALHPVGPVVVGGMILFPLDAGVLRRFDECARACSDDVSAVGLLVTAPDGRPALAVLACHSGPAAEAERALGPLRRLGRPIADLLEARSYVEMQALTDANWPAGRLYYWKSSLVRSLEDDAVDTLLEFAARKPTASSVIFLQQLHGAASRIDPAATAFPHRFDHFDTGAMLNTDDPRDLEEGRRWAQTCWQAMQPFAERAVYVNDLGEEGDARVLEAYGANHERLVAVKARYDPDNVFRLNQNIVPSAVP